MLYFALLGAALLCYALCGCALLYYASMCGCVIKSLRALRAHSLFAQKLNHLSKFWRKSCLLDFCLMEHPAGQAASAAKPDRSNANKIHDKAIAVDDKAIADLIDLYVRGHI